MVVTPGGSNTLLVALNLLQTFFSPLSHPLSTRDLQNPPLLPNDRQSAQFGNVDAIQARHPSRFEASTRRMQARDDPCAVEPYNAPPVGMQTFPQFDQTTATVYRYRQQQSVNLGSWFVHESWMTPSLYQCASDPKVSEVDIASGWGSTQSARWVLERHWDTFITESDFKNLASIGINTVRLPIGYWNLGPNFVQGTPYSKVGDVYANCWPRIVRTINIANKYGIGVLVDLHGAVGSQNGRDHSGVSDGTARLFNSPDNIKKTLNVLTFLTQNLVNVSNVVGIQILNEPDYADNLEDFYTQAISAMRSSAPGAETFPLYMHDGFDLDRFSNFITKRNDFVVQDHHSYFVFTPNDQSLAASAHTANVNGPIAQSLQRVSDRQHRNLVVDEWSCALTAQSLQGEKNPDQAQQTFCTAQMDVYANTSAGWSFWAYRKEDCNSDPGWCFLAAVGKALPSTFFSYGAGASKAVLANNYDNPSASNPSPSPTTYNAYYQHPDAPLIRGQNIRRPRPVSFAKRQQAKCSLRKRDDSDYNPSSTPSGTSPAPAPFITDPAQKGYSDGYMTAQIFSQHGSSKLGFTGQYIRDSIDALRSRGLNNQNQGAYTDSFVKGLSEGEAAVVAGHA